MNNTLVFTTDIHFNFVTPTVKDKFYEKILSHNPTSLLITGDISEAPHLINHLTELRQGLGSTIPIYFVAGNHDYYNGSIVEVREILRNLYGPGSDTNMFWLGGCAPIALTENVALVGHDGWYDGNYGNWFQYPKVDMSDYYVIREIANARYGSEKIIYNTINELSQQAADYLYTQLEETYSLGFRRVYVATHVAPFPELSTFQGKISNATWLPCFSSKRMGDMLTKFAANHLDMRLTILCGHSHGKAYHRFTRNLDGYAGEADYGYPMVNGVFNF